EWPDPRLRQPPGHDADGFRRSADECRRLLGSGAAEHGARPELSDEPLRLRSLHLRPPARLSRSTAEMGGRLPYATRPDDQRVRRQREALTPAGVGEHYDRNREGSCRGLVPAIPE